MSLALAAHICTWIMTCRVMSVTARMEALVITLDVNATLVPVKVLTLAPTVNTGRAIFLFMLIMEETYHGSGADTSDSYVEHTRLLSNDYTHQSQYRKSIMEPKPIMEPKIRFWHPYMEKIRSEGLG